MGEVPTVLLLPAKPDASAKRLGQALEKAFGVRVGVLITDSDGREDIAGATQLCVGSYGVPPVRRHYGAQETICDMLAAAVGLVMGQRGNHVPAAVVCGFSYPFDETARLADAY
jgi:coenzyme F420-0:L-glutamate ligase / coenzyme F420-1:gamma-L-glutamate ligase